MDVRMPDLDGIAATDELTRTMPATKVLILTTFEQDDYVVATPSPLAARCSPPLSPAS